MYEHMASLFGGPPNDSHFSLYSKWSAGKWGMIITGNVQVSCYHLSLGRDIIVPEMLTEDTMRPFKRLASMIHGQDANTDSSPLAIMQLSHTGRQSANIIGGRLPFMSPHAPSSVRLDLDKTGSWSLSSLLSWLMFQTPHEMCHSEIDAIVEAFVRGARLAVESGFDGIELHGGHGCAYVCLRFVSFIALSIVNDRPHCRVYFT
jgi:2,4-dienoyl-CoA reductase-like NADH-dependent reductase (Old Yellow Enzyme family)